MYWLIIGKKRVCARSPGVLQYESDTGSLYLQSETERERERERERDLSSAGMDIRSRPQLHVHLLRILRALVFRVATCKIINFQSKNLHHLSSES